MLQIPLQAFLAGKMIYSKYLSIETPRTPLNFINNFQST